MLRCAVTFARPASCYACVDAGTGAQLDTNRETLGAVDMGIYKRKYCFTVVAVVALLALGVFAQAAPDFPLFMQDDLVLNFGEPGNPSAIGTALELDGRVVFWDVNMVAGWFQFSGATTADVEDLGAQWRANFNDPSAVLTITEFKTGGTVLWQGSVDFFYICGNKDGSMFPASGFDRPAYEVEPSEFNGCGSAGFTQTGGSWSHPTLALEWLGTYNMTLDGPTVGESENAFGNLQGKLVVVPEPSGMLAMFVGVLGMAGFVNHRRRNY